MEKLKPIIYTALFGPENCPLDEIGDLRVPPYNDNSEAEFIAFTNRQDLKSDFWNIKYVELSRIPRLEARYYKLNPHKVLPEHKFNIWIDHQVFFTVCPLIIINKYLTEPQALIAIHHHGDLNSLAVEGIFQCWKYRNDLPEIILPQLLKYGNEGFPMINYHHFETGILIRENCALTTDFNEAWWDEVKKHSLRDQLSCPYVVWKYRNIKNLPIFTIPESFTAHQNILTIPKSKVFFTRPKPAQQQDLSSRMI